MARPRKQKIKDEPIRENNINENEPRDPNKLYRGDFVYYAQSLPNLNEFNVIDLKVRMVEESWFSCTEKITKRAYIFNNSDLDRIVFRDRLSALEKARSDEEDYRKPKKDKIDEIENELLRKLNG